MSENAPFYPDVFRDSGAQTSPAGGLRCSIVLTPLQKIWERIIRVIRFKTTQTTKFYKNQNSENGQRGDCGHYGNKKPSETVKLPINPDKNCARTNGHTDGQTKRRLYANCKSPAIL
ncbi:hypothetical protein DPMN_055692 [Dreissena polymorpha]|uniref:Uncharacterized protein n=1 Tax=Dreissena polymorpha TaxID=45954 RepID=A0A9D4HSI5_DREPO|nr:hypothetical protein DPMN_055692 [Dreissena polymorpha]